MTRLKIFLNHISKRENRKKYFWYWISYQAVKGCLTTAFIWIPLLYANFYLH